MGPLRRRLSSPFFSSSSVTPQVATHITVSPSSFSCLRYVHPSAECPPGDNGCKLTSLRFGGVGVIDAESACLGWYLWGCSGASCPRFASPAHLFSCQAHQRVPRCCCSWRRIDLSAGAALQSISFLLRRVIYRKISNMCFDSSALLCIFTGS